MAENVVPVTNKKTGETEILKGKPDKPTSKMTPSFSKNREQNEIGHQANAMMQDGFLSHEPDKEDSVRQKENCNPEPSSLFEFIAYYYRGKKNNPNELGKKLTHFLVNEQLTDCQITELTNLVKENDLELNKTRSLSELMLRESCYNKDSYQSMLDLLERVINLHLNNGMAETNKLSILTEENNGKKILDVFVEKIETAIKRQQKQDKDSKQPTDNRLKKKISYQSLKANLILIGCSWLHHFKYVDENIIFNCLSVSVFPLKIGKPENFISAHSLAFVSSINATGNKKDFSYFLSFFIKDNSRNQVEISALKKQIEALENEKSKLSSEVEDHKKEINTLSEKLNSSESEIARLNREMSSNSEHARHQEIHLKDISKKNQSKFLRFLEDDIFNMLLDVQKGLQRSPPKIETAESYLEVVIEKIQEKMKCLK
jgi:hypothetical protein